MRAQGPLSVLAYIVLSDGADGDSIGFHACSGQCTSSPWRGT